MKTSKTTFVAALFFLLSIFTAVGQSTVYIVRHAEKAKDVKGDDNPPLTEDGQKRAQALAEKLRNKDIKRIYVSEKTRSQDTAAPLASALSITPTRVDKTNIGHLVTLLKSRSGNALVVGHSDSIPKILTELGIKPPLEKEITRYNNLFIVSLDDHPTLVRQTYE
jgi:phosphohistidine phosphatase SixA